MDGKSTASQVGRFEHGLLALDTMAAGRYTLPAHPRDVKASRTVVISRACSTRVSRAREEISMRSRLSGWTFGTVTALLTAAATSGIFWFTEKPTAGQTHAYRAPRTPDGKPNLNGIWQALNTANWDLLDHAARPSPVIAMGALGAAPGGLGVVEGGEIPYQPQAVAKKKENFDNWLLRDPTVKCYLPGVPRATYMPFPFQIVQTPDAVLIAYEFASASRTVYMNSKEESPVDTWMGWSRGHWEGETLV